MAHFTYLLINIFTIAIPFSLSFESKVHFYKKWKYYLPALFITAAIFIVWDYYKTKFGVWQFNDEYIIGIKFFGLPLEEYLFFFTVPYSCSFIYEVLAYYIKKDYTPIATKSLLTAIGFVFLITSFFALPRAYTWSVLFGMFLIIPLLVYVLDSLKTQQFLLMFLISLFPMAIVNGVLTAMPVVIYNNAQNLGIRAFTIPVEDFLYSFIMLGLNIGLYEMFQSFKLQSNTALNQPPINA